MFLLAIMHTMPSIVLRWHAQILIRLDKFLAINMRSTYSNSLLEQGKKKLLCSFYNCKKQGTAQLQEGPQQVLAHR